MNKWFNTPVKKMVAFTVLYIALIASLIVGAVQNSDNAKSETKSSSNEVAQMFKEEMSKYKTDLKEQQAAQTADNKWRPSNEFVRNAMITASILDVVIILLWARHENNKRKNSSSTKKRLTDQKWFWNVAALGIVQPRDNRIVVNWRNLIIVVIAMYLLKTVALDRILKNESAEKAASFLLM